MAVPLNDVQSRIGISNRVVKTPSLATTLRGLTRPRCPECGRRGMVCRYVVPESYAEASPRYFECADCTARYFRTVTGPWFSAAGPQFSNCYETAA